MRFPLHISAMLGPGLLSLGLVMEKANKDVCRWLKLGLLCSCGSLLQGWQ